MKQIEDYTTAEFTDFVRKIMDAEFDDDAMQDNMVLEFKRITGHPSGSDLIYWPAAGQDSSAEGIVAEVNRWRKENGLSSFSDS